MSMLPLTAQYDQIGMSPKSCDFCHGAAGVLNMSSRIRDVLPGRSTTRASTSGTQPRRHSVPIAAAGGDRMERSLLTVPLRPGCRHAATSAEKALEDQ